MILSKLLWNTRLGGDSPARRDTAPPIAGGCGDVGQQRRLVANNAIQIFVCGAANQTHALAEQANEVTLNEGLLAERMAALQKAMLETQAEIDRLEGKTPAEPEAAQPVAGATGATGVGVGGVTN